MVSFPVHTVKDLVTLIGNLTGTSMFDKKGLLSPVNPCLDKVVFFRPNSEGCCLTVQVSSKCSPRTRFDSNLRAIGQCLLLNRCDARFTPFLDHLSAVANTVPRTIATGCRRCSCAFPQLIGFKPSSKDQFHAVSDVLGFYQRRPGEAPLPGLTKHQTPLEMAFCTAHADDRSLYYHLSCQGTASLVLEACSHVWDGEQLVPINERIVKLATDFYQRHSVTGFVYCLALSYRPIGAVLDESIKNRYFEVPLLRDRPSSGALAKTHSLESSQGDPLFHRTPLKTADEVIQRWFTGHTLCGMIVTQYEVTPQAVQLIDHLESLCVRFVFFSRENELRSRVFAEKLGLEAGWNCHVSLAEIPSDGDGRSLKDFFLSKSRFPLLSKIRFRKSVSVQVAVPPNKARLPTGIGAVRPHLEQVDNVPLLVGLITDCTPQANQQMLEIMQRLSAGQCLRVASLSSILSRVAISVNEGGCRSTDGSSQRFSNVFRSGTSEVRSNFGMERLCLQLLALPKLIVACRHRCASLKGSLTFHFFASSMLSIALLITTISFLPLLFDFEQVFLTVFIQLPLLTTGSVFTPFHPKSTIIRISYKVCLQIQCVSEVCIHLIFGNFKLRVRFHETAFIALDSSQSAVDLDTCTAASSCCRTCVCFLLPPKKGRRLDSSTRWYSRLSIRQDEKLSFNFPLL
ncbi:unnamed protein product [Nippostrongylus brasiliensis]|uniref:Lethal (2) k05819 (inferred by orthology to a D. melanogaster protein) n=1 Tax=Nippostrongylus brasiliensis TaxID=27835 RepID=A0A0N4XDI8_NIPBR|nr:unnamed protein product [Nippostrongylus brasiliensis]